LDANIRNYKIIQDGQSKGRIFVEDDFFDLFLPPTRGNNNNSRGNVHHKHGLVLFPGALVDYRAYAGVAQRLSDKGIVVVLFNTEHYHRMPIEIFGCNMKRIEKAVSLLETRYKISVQSWSCGGHSLGGFTAQLLVKNHPTFFKNAILWGIYRELMMGDHVQANVLVVQATNDGVCKLFRQDPERQKFLDSIARVQGRTSVHDIQGGNHGGFGDYEKQIFPCPDGERTISLDEMHTELVQVTADFILLGEEGGDDNNNNNNNNINNNKKNE
jgi:predicted esterase